MPADAGLLSGETVLGERIKETPCVIMYEKQGTLLLHFGKVLPVRVLQNVVTVRDLNP